MLSFRQRLSMSLSNLHLTIPDYSAALDTIDYWISRLQGKSITLRQFLGTLSKEFVEGMCLHLEVDEQKWIKDILNSFISELFVRRRFHVYEYKLLRGRLDYRAGRE
jgi:hypothetical protein